MNKFLITAFFLVLLATSGDAQLLGSPQIRRELGLSHQTSVLILRDLNEAARLNRGGVMTSEANRDLQAEREKSPSPEVLSRRAINRLTPAQKKRLEQIELQRGDPFVLQNWRIAQQIGMKRTQYDAFNRVTDRAFKRKVQAEQSLFQRDKSWWMQANRKKYAARYAAHESEQKRIGAHYLATVKNALNQILTPAQKAKWVQIKGKPFGDKLTSDLQSYPID